jgi:hypothetical protein
VRLVLGVLEIAESKGVGVRVEVVLVKESSLLSSTRLSLSSESKRSFTLSAAPREISSSFSEINGIYIS